MPARVVVARELAETFRALGHECRIRIVEELAHGDHGELDVHSLVEILEVPQPTVSQHLSVLRHAKLVKQRRAGRSVHYSLTNRGLASWLLQGLRFLDTRSQDAQELSRAVEDVRRVWS
ncbi:MAG: metalloregulator ArsR/SmtB family transcription factor [Gammaproteobacteria bacterium]|nr:metalloregulator ArsR/SmtB family transcription factor [Gammaproteobacteria bacterium]